MSKSISVPRFYDAQKFFSGCQSKCNEHILLIFPEMAQHEGFESSTILDTLCVSGCVSGWAGSSVITPWAKYLSILQRPKKGWQPACLFVCLILLVCLTSMHIYRTIKVQEGQMCMYFQFLLRTSPCHKLPPRQTVSEQTTLLHTIALIAWFSPQLFTKREISEFKQ